MLRLISMQKGIAKIEPNMKLLNIGKRSETFSTDTREEPVMNTKNEKISIIVPFTPFQPKRKE